MDFELYSSTGEPVAATGSRSLSADHSVSNYFDDTVKAIIKVGEGDNVVTVLSSLRARSNPTGRYNTYYIRFQFDASTGKAALETELRQFLTEQTGLTLPDTGSQFASPIHYLPSVSEGSHIGDEELENLGTVLDEWLSWLQFTAPDVKSGLSLALAVLSQTPADSIVLTETDHHITRGQFDAIVYLDDRAGVTVTRESSDALERYHEQQAEAEIESHLESITEEIELLQRETPLSDAGIRYRVQSELPSLSVLERVRFRGQQLKSRGSTRSLRRRLPSVSVPWRNKQSAEGVQDLEVVKSKKSTTGWLRNRLRMVRYLVPLLVLLSLTFAGIVLWGGQMHAVSMEVWESIVVFVVAYVPGPVVAWVPIPVVDQSVRDWVVGVLLLGLLCMLTIRVWRGR